MERKFTLRKNNQSVIKCKLQFFTWCFFLIAQLFFIQESAKAVTAYPYPIEYTQPDRSIITVQLKGDEKVHWAETIDGYSLQYNSSGTLEYAMLNEKNDMVPSGIQAHNLDRRTTDEIIFLENTPLHLLYSESQISVFKQIWKATNSTKLGGFPTTGTRKFLMILANYSNTTPTFTQAMFNNYMNQVSYNGTGSFRDFFLESSYGQLIVNTTVTVWVTLTNPHNSYSTSDVDLVNWQKMVYEAVVAANPLVNYADYDNNSDGIVDGIAVIHQGMGQEESGSVNDVWSHNSSLSAYYSAAQRTFDGVYVDPYTTQPELSSGGMGNIGVMCHEFGHNLGAPDFYDTDYGTNGQYDGTGNWDLQAGGSWNGNPAGSTPAQPNAYTKTVVYGWATAQVLSTGCNITLYNSAENQNSFYRINTNTSNEYYLCENIQQIGFDTYVPGHGMIIYHVNATVGTSAVNAAHPNKMYIVAANAPVAQPVTPATPSEYGSINSASCSYPGTGNETSFTDATIPCSKSWAGVNTNKPLTNISENTTSHVITFTFNGGPGCTLPTTQASVLTESAITTTTMTVGWTRGNGDAVLVVARAGEPVNADPVLGSTYTASASFGGGSTIGTGNYVIYKGTGTSVDITNLVSNTTYYFAVYEYKTASYCYLMPALTGYAATNSTPVPPVADFTSDKTTIYKGQSISFFEAATNSPTSWSWTFENGFPSTSTDRTPVVTWIANGTYDVTLTVTNADGSDIETKTDYITVNNMPSLPASNPKIIGTVPGTAGTYWPLGTSTTTYKYVVDVSIYTSAEIGGGGKITTLEWNPSTSRADSRNIQIYLKHTSASTLSASTVASYTAGATWVYSGTYTPNTTSWLAFNITNEFIYNGTDNLMVIVLVNGASNAASNCYYTTAATKHQQWNGSTQPAGSGTVNGNRPNIRLTFFTPPAAPTANFAGLDTPVLTQDFEGGAIPPSGWVSTKGATGNNWSLNTGAAHGGTYAARYIYHATQAATAWLISSGVSLTAGVTYNISYWERVGPGYTEKLKVTVGNAQTIVAQTTTLQDLSSLTNTSYVQQTTTFTPGSNGTYYFGWNCYSAANQYYLDVDDISIAPFNYTQIYTYEGDPISIYDKSTGNPITWEWTTPGATSTTSSSQNVTLTYNTAGTYDVTLKAGNIGGTTTKTVTGFVVVQGRAPVADFAGTGNFKTTLYNPFIPIGGTVTFSDLSTRRPTSWNWTFTNGSPASSSLQTPPEVTYNSNGSQDVSLYTSNASGNNTKAQSGYVKVGGTYNVTNWFSSDAMANYSLTGGSGYLPGHCATSGGTQFTKYAEFFDNAYPGTITGFKVYMHYASTTAGKNVIITVWDGSTGVPGTVLGSQTYAINSFAAGADNTKTFTTSINVTGDFFIGYELSYDATHDYTVTTGHMFCPYMAATRSSKFETLWTMYNGSWYALKSVVGGVYSSIAIRPEFTYKSCPSAFNVTGGGSFCTGGSGVAVGLDGSESGVNYQLIKDGANDGSPVAGTGSAISFGNKTAAGNYTVKATKVSTSCSNDMNGNVNVSSYYCYNWTGATSTDWSVTGNWSSGKVPLASDPVYIPSAPSRQPHITASLASPALCKDLTIYSGASLIIDPGKALTASGPTTIQGGGTFTIESDVSNGTGSFIDNGSITGNVTVKKSLTDSRWWYISSPLSSSVTASSAFGLLSGTPGSGRRLAYYNEANHAYTYVADDYLLNTPLRGHLYKDNNVSELTTVVFSGSLNTGVITASNLTRQTSGSSLGFNLICNPYPSAINLGDNTSPANNTPGLTMTNLETTFWFYNNGSYKTYNWTSGIGIGTTRYVPAMQSFFVRVKTSDGGAFSIDNRARCHNSQAFYKTEAETNVFRIQLQQDSLNDEAVVAFFSDASNDYDDFDSYKMFSDDNDYPQIYTVTDDNTEVAINGQTEFNEGTDRIIPLGFLTNIEGTFILKATNLSVFDPDISVYLEDTYLNKFQKLNILDSYSFTSGVVDDASRFKLHFGNSLTDLSYETENSILLYVIGSAVYINAPDKSLIEIYNTIGEKVAEQKADKGLNKIQVNTSQGIYIVKVLSGSDIVTKKIFIGN
jgi:M6 family metalloprotease-like protein